MKHVAELAKQNLSAPFLKVVHSDCICPTIYISGSLDTRGNWLFDIFENSRYFKFFIVQKDEKVSVTLISAYHKLPKFRKVTAAPEKAIQKIQEYIDKISE